MSAQDDALVTQLNDVSFLYADAVQGALEPWGLRDGANQGNPQTSGRILFSVGGTIAGVWECTPGGWDTVDRPATEAMMFLRGKARITTAGGETRTFQAGDTFVLPKGWNGRWEVLETVRKFFVEVK